MDTVLIGESTPSFSSLAYDDVNLQWEMRQILFEASSSTHNFKFLPLDDDDIIQSSIDASVRMGIDSIWIEPVSLTNIAAIVKPGLKAFPNPCEESINIHFEGVMDLEIIDLFGKQELFIPNATSGKVDVSNLHSGQYLIRLVNEFKNTNIRFFKI